MTLHKLVTRGIVAYGRLDDVRYVSERACEPRKKGELGHTVAIAHEEHVVARCLARCFHPPYYVKIAGKANVRLETVDVAEVVAYLDRAHPRAGIVWDGDNYTPRSPFTQVVKELAARGRHCVAVKDYDDNDPLSADFVQGWRGVGVYLMRVRENAHLTPNLAKETITRACTTHVVNVGSVWYPDSAGFRELPLHPFFPLGEAVPVVTYESSDWSA